MRGHPGRHEKAKRETGAWRRRGAGGEAEAQARARVCGGGGGGGGGVADVGRGWGDVGVAFHRCNFAGGGAGRGEGGAAGEDEGGSWSRAQIFAVQRAVAGAPNTQRAMPFPSAR